ncbi:hypothetical protein BHYA_0740g00010 [Botrytis hyacinthi]|uniref:Uncharacterized protein n=1 Tax=Botrytis hyacinthi TaxID=278943 RepID=A0A4Z1G8T7_9HELO|nr:hypothetical protein BHYA_0740g00010 [Botrytis hyacinthi]
MDRPVYRESLSDAELNEHKPYYPVEFKKLNFVANMNELAFTSGVGEVSPLNHDLCLFSPLYAPEDALNIELEIISGWPKDGDIN